MKQYDWIFHIIVIIACTVFLLFAFWVFSYQYSECRENEAPVYCFLMYKFYGWP